MTIQTSTLNVLQLAESLFPVSLASGTVQNTVLPKQLIDGTSSDIGSAVTIAYCNYKTSCMIENVPTILSTVATPYFDVGFIVGGAGLATTSFDPSILPGFDVLFVIDLCHHIDPDIDAYNRLLLTKCIERTQKAVVICNSDLDLLCRPVVLPKGCYVEFDDPSWRMVNKAIHSLQVDSDKINIDNSKSIIHNAQALHDLRSVCKAYTTLRIITVCCAEHRQDVYANIGTAKGAHADLAKYICNSWNKHLIIQTMTAANCFVVSMSNLLSRVTGNNTTSIPSILGTNVSKTDVEQVLTNIMDAISKQKATADEKAFLGLLYRVLVQPNTCVLH